MQQKSKINQMLGPVLLFIAVAGLAIILAGLIGLGAGIYVLLFVLGLVFIVIGSIDFRVCVVAMVIMLPLSSTQFFPRQLFGLTGVNPFNLMFILGFLSFGLSRFFARTQTSVKVEGFRFFWPVMLAMLVATYIGSGHLHQIPLFYRLEQPDLFESRPQYFRDVFVKPLMLFGSVWLLANAVARSKGVQGWIAAIVAGSAGIACMVWFFVAMSGFSFGSLSSAGARTFLSPTGMHANEIGVALLPAYAACLFIFRHLKSGWSKVGIAGVGVLVLSATLLTFSRAAMLALLIVTILFVFRLRKPVWILGGLIVVSVAVLFAPQPIQDRVTEGFEIGAVGAKNDALTAGRVRDIWAPLAPEIARQPLLGNGINSTMWSQAARSGIIVVGHPHNAYLLLLMDYGVVLGALVVFFLVSIWRLWRALSRDAERDPVERAFFDGICAAFLAFLVQGLSGSSLVFGISHAVYLGALGIALGVIAKKPIAVLPNKSRNLKRQPELLRVSKGRAWV
ncbi:O-antigen ligase family protein [Roseateles albus]|uniref:O-antigen ligase family protein n=1 Tax=Roseateles albus TaxID=2987525 RepID=A0ABT5KDR2_9BURK|nr:O-antigen ligase family protein [Roseateles albus]MDC8772074.1 O-antigen ligase family protein [Roseateles albus]